MSDLFQRPVIDSFRGKYEFLSNFYQKGFAWKGMFWVTAEHAYQAQKCILDEEYVLFLDPSLTAGQAKRLGRKVSMDSGWDSVKLSVMEDIVTAKFSDPELQDLLLGTDDAILIEGNTWGDKFWGVCEGEGKNHLGLILMYVRDNLRKKNGC